MITWRKKWERDWDRVRYCSDRCRRARPSRDDDALEQAILAQLRGLPATATICPSDAARAVFDSGWSDRLEQARSAARRLAATGQIEMIRDGRAVDPSTARGPVRLRLRRSASG
jgi:hypothetical protein